jgi:superkiller protein 3
MLDKKEYQEAVIQFRKAVEIWPLSATYWYWLGNALMYENLFKEAERAYQRAIELGYEDKSILVGVYSKLGKLEEAEEILRDNIRQKPTDPSPMISLAIFLEKHDRKSEAYSVYLSVGKIYLERGEDWSNARSAEMWLKEAIRLFPEKPEAHQLLEIAHRNEDEDLKRLDEEEAQRDLVFTLTEKAIDLEARGEVEEAKKAISYALMIGPDNAETYFVLAHLSWRMGVYDTAEKLCLLGIELKDDDAGAWYLLGYINLQRRTYERAVTAFRRMINLGQDTDSGWFLLGCTLLLMQQVSDAQAAFDKAIEINSKLFNLVSDLLASSRVGNMENIMKLARSVLSTIEVQSFSTWVCINCGAPFNTLEINYLRDGKAVECRSCGHSITHDLYFT